MASSFTLGTSITTCKNKFAHYQALQRNWNFTLSRHFCSLSSKNWKRLENTTSFYNNLIYAAFLVNIPLNDTIELAVEYAFSNNYDISICSKDFKKFFQFPTSGTHFYFNRNIYEKINGVPMGSPLAPVLANISFILY